MINVLVFNISLVEGMAGSMRVKRLLSPLVNNGDIRLHNLIMTSVFEKQKIGIAGISNEMPYLYIGYKNSFNIIKLISFFKKGLNFIRKEKDSTSKNVMYIYGYPDVKNIWFILYAKRLGYKIVFDIVEDNRFQSKFNSFFGWLRSKTSIFFLHRIPAFANAVIVISKHLENRMVAICKDKIPVYLIPVVVDFTHFLPHKNEPRKSFTIFYGGSFGEKDGLSYLLEAFNIIFKKYQNVQLVLTGKPTFESDLEKLKINAEGIKYKGFLSEEEYYNELNNADIFCMTRINNPWSNAGFPFKLGEFLATGKAVIATGVGDIAEYIENGRNALLIKPESVTDIVDAIEFFILNPEKIAEMGNEARKTALHYFDALKLSKEVQSYFKKL